MPSCLFCSVICGLTFDLAVWPFPVLTTPWSSSWETVSGSLWAHLCSCYILKKLCALWEKTGQTHLFVFPLCGFLRGSSNTSVCKVDSVPITSPTPFPSDSLLPLQRSRGTASMWAVSKTELGPEKEWRLQKKKCRINIYILDQFLIARCQKVKSGSWCFCLCL